MGYAAKAPTILDLLARSTAVSHQTCTSPKSPNLCSARGWQRPFKRAGRVAPRPAHRSQLAIRNLRFATTREKSMTRGRSRLGHHPPEACGTRAHVRTSRSVPRRVPVPVRRGTAGTRRVGCPSNGSAHTGTTRAHPQRRAFSSSSRSRFFRPMRPASPGCAASSSYSSSASRSSSSVISLGTT